MSQELLTRVNTLNTKLAVDVSRDDKKRWGKVYQALQTGVDLAGDMSKEADNEGFKLWLLGKRNVLARTLRDLHKDAKRQGYTF